ncbi:hypothetical protein GGX14DRAFT_637099 [Mycena pura]|uniref:Uncharacterized protein n=1 Tax=Mycena pura TaxID=153505 RepID=A0AAD6V9M8_9AGAR|nr:hypothetical protein GGX14DRAFT_637099 [Mycena pura]
MAQSGARKKKNKLERERKEKEVQAQQTPVSPSTPSPSPTPNDHADISTTRPSHITPRIPDSTPRDWSVLHADDSREYSPHPWRTIRQRKRRVHVCSASRSWERLPKPAQHPLSPSSPPQRTPSLSLPPQPQSVPPSVQTLPTPAVPSAAPPVSRPPALQLKTMPPPPDLPPIVPPCLRPDREHSLRRLRAMFTSPELRTTPTPTIAGTARSPFAVALGAVFSRPDDILNGISLATWGMPNDERREFLRYLPPDQLLIFAALTHIFISEPDLAPFLLPSMADYVEDFVERCEEPTAVTAKSASADVSSKLPDLPRKRKRNGLIITIPGNPPQSLPIPPRPVIAVDTSITSAAEPSANAQIQQLNAALRKQTVQIRRLIRERDALEAGSDSTSSKPPPRLASIERELRQIIEARNTIGRELEDLLSEGQPESDEDYIPPPKAANTMRSHYPKLMSYLNRSRVLRACVQCGYQIVAGLSGQYFLDDYPSNRFSSLE